MPSARQRALQWAAVWLVLVCGASAASAGFKTMAPRDVSLAGLWKLNAELSDDAQKVIDGKRAKSAPRPTAGSSRRGRISIPIPDAGDILGGIGGIGRDDGADPSDGGVSGRARTGNSHIPEHDDTGSTDPDHEEKMRGFVDQMLVKPPEEIEIEQRPDALRVQSPDTTDTCRPGESSQVMLPGTVIADRHCGWSGAVFVIEVKSRTGGTRTDRYTLSNGGNRLTVSATLSGSSGRWSGLEIKHVYDRAVSLVQ